nr:MAG TPA: hypothetical protein [Caudoviricetes sp.]
MIHYYTTSLSILGFDKSIIARVKVIHQRR